MKMPLRPGKLPPQRVVVPTGESLREASPLTDLCLELREGEQASYTIRDVKEPCQVSIHARCVEPGSIQIVCEGAGGKEMWEFPMAEVGEITPQVMVAAGMCQTVTVCASQGCVQIDELEFAG